MTDPQEANPQSPPNSWAPGPHKTTPSTETLVRRWLIVLSLVVLSLSLLTALVALDQAVTIWLQYQYAPFFRAAAGLIVAAVALYVVVRLTKRS